MLRGQARLCLVLRHSLFSASTLLLVIRHVGYVGRHVFVCASTPLFSIVPYLRVPIVLCPSHSLFSVYTGKHLYDKIMNNVIYGNNYMKSQIIGYVLLCTFGYPLFKIYVMYSYGRYENYNI